MENTEIYKEKERFIKKLQLFYIRDCKNPDTIKRLDYLYDEESGNEFLYVTYKAPRAQKRIFITGDGIEAIYKDFARYLDHKDDFFWLIPSQGSYKEEFTEDEQ